MTRHRTIALVVLAVVLVAGAATALGASTGPDLDEHRAVGERGGNEAGARVGTVAGEQAGRKEGRAEGVKAGRAQTYRPAYKTAFAKSRKAAYDRAYADEKARQAAARQAEIDAARAARMQQGTNWDMLDQYGCDPTYIFPDGTNGCTHEYND